MAEKGLFARLKSGLFKTSERISSGLQADYIKDGKLDPNIEMELEDRLLMADVGIDTTSKILDSLQQKIANPDFDSSQALLSVLKSCLVEILEPCNQPLLLGKTKPFAILVVGVNGAGKTTTIGKIAKRLKRNRKSVMLAAGDTFRAAAVEQLLAWGERNDVPVVAQDTGADSAAVIYDAYESAQAKGVDVLIGDTAGRLHTQSNLMQELEKVKRVVQKLDAAAPHEVLLVLEAATGQNAMRQAEEFHQALGVTGLAITKLDGTAKGGMVLALADRFGIPIRYIGVGESAEDLRVFDAEEFANALLGLDLDA